MDLAAVRQQVPWYYAKLLDWRQDGDIVKAVPKRKLSYRAHDTILKVFKQLGGAFVKGSSGKLYFELVLRNRISDSVAINSTNESYSSDVHGRLGRQLQRLIETGRQLTASSGKRVIVGLSPPPGDIKIRKAPISDEARLCQTKEAKR